jgi:hypothetical protein
LAGIQQHVWEAEELYNRHQNLICLRLEIKSHSEQDTNFGAAKLAFWPSQVRSSPITTQYLPTQ